VRYNVGVAVAALQKSTDELIVDAADRLIGRYGLRKMTMEDVAQEAGVSRRTVYGYFKNKQALAMASIERVVKKAQARMAEEAKGPEAPAEKIYRMLVARVAARLEGVKDITQSLDSVFSVVRPAYMQRRRRYFEEEAKMLADVIREGQREGAFGGADPIETARLLVQATNSYLPYSLSLEELGQPGDLIERIEKMAAILVAGILR
jgi:AcrR family transcriptional regulator